MTAIYGRQSIDKGEQSLSIESQYEECVKRVPKGEAVEFYKDRGYSGSNTDRPDFIRLMNDVKNGRVQRLIVWKLDRISRSLLDFANIISVFTERKVSFDSVTEQLDTTSPMGRAMINIIMVFAQLERETIQMRIASNYLKRAERGFFLGGTALFGLAKKPITVNGYKTSTYELCPKHGGTLLLIFEKYADENVSLGMLARYLNDNGHTAPNGTRWEGQKLSRILHNPTYVISNADVYQFYKARGVNIISPIDDFAGNGLYLFGKRKGNERKYSIFNDHSLAVALHKGFIDSRIWLKIQYKLEANVQIGNSGKGKYTWLSGLAKCGHCGYALAGQQMGKYIVLRCSRRTNYRDCEAKSVHADITEQQVWSALLEKIEELRDVKFSLQTKIDANENKIKMELVKIEEQIERLVAAIADGNKPKSLMKRISELETKQTELETQLQQERAKTPTIDTETILDLAHENLTFDEKKQVAKAMIKRVLIKDGETPVIEWRF